MHSTQLSPKTQRAILDSCDTRSLMTQNPVWDTLRWDETQKHWPTLGLEDVSDIPFVEGVPGVEEYQHRARVRANTHDLFVAVTAPTPGYEEYCVQKLNLGSPSFIQADPMDGRIIEVAKACNHGKTFEALCAYLHDQAGLVIHPYMSIHAVWELASSLRQATKKPVKVLGPVPEALWYANDKSSLDQLIRALNLDDMLVHTERATQPEAATAHLRTCAARFEQVGLKRTRCASAMGNEVFDSKTILAEPMARTLERVQGFFKERKCSLGEEVLIVEWADTMISPSTQLWIPSKKSGISPRLEGIYEQLLEGEEKCFVGSRPSTLPNAVHQKMAHASLCVATIFQELGYSGRCSFDFIVVGDIHAHPRVMFTECNGRWGGTSTPMHLVDRIYKGDRPHYIAKDVIFEGLIGAQFDDLVATLGHEAFDTSTQQGRFILYNPGPLKNKGKIDVIAIGSSPEDARWAMDELLPSLWQV